MNYWKSAFFTELSDGAVQTMIEAFEATPSIMTGMVIEHFHGAVCRVDPTATAYPFREPGYNLVLTTPARPPSPSTSPARQWRMCPCGIDDLAHPVPPRLRRASTPEAATLGLEALLRPTTQ